MARRANSSSNVVTRAAKKLTARLRKPKQKAAEVVAASPVRREKKAVPAATPERKRRPQTDIPVDALSKAYTPTQTSLKAPFRASGADQQRDQEFARGVADDRWNDEDKLTNKSGDPRIGTHGRTYEPGEKRSGSKGRR
jgi:hypothetical protein